MTTLGTGVLRVRHWLRDHPLALDAALALAVLVAMIVGSFVHPRPGEGPSFEPARPRRAACC